jgi:hypothetical protein
MEGQGHVVALVEGKAAVCITGIREGKASANFVRCPVPAA